MKGETEREGGRGIERGRENESEIEVECERQITSSDADDGMMSGRLKHAPSDLFQNCTRDA